MTSNILHDECILKLVPHVYHNKLDFERSGNVNEIGGAGAAGKYLDMYVIFNWTSLRFAHYNPKRMCTLVQQTGV